MAELISEWAGKDRLFRLSFGDVMDLEQACRGDAIGEILLRVAAGKYRLEDVYQVIRIGLIGGGVGKVEAKRLSDAHFDLYPLADNAALAAEILTALFAGVEKSGAPNDGEAEPVRFSEVSQICRVFNMSPLELRAMDYADFINLVKGFNAGSSRKAEPPTVEEFEDILARYEPEALNSNG
ncbi:gene transfer agent family protein [Martelella endophytica]|uniref:gene transfer agent family protein n=1 Tax=Martelella endophytica TaxID=1486262 RepID=UPI0006989348|nr:gene transfer agent family protein [Martelella endophytica]